MAVKCMSLKNIGVVACFIVVLVTCSACSMFCETLFFELVMMCKIALGGWFHPFFTFLRKILVKHLVV